MSEVENDQAENVKGRVLVVDDEEYNRLLLRDLLETRGHQVEEAANGKEALQAVAAQLPDIILLDIMMPGMDGFEVCRRLKEEPRTAHIPVLMITALREREDLLRGIELGANDFLSKPIDVQEVMLRVRNGIYAKKLFDENLSFRRELEKKVEEQTQQLRQAYARLELQVKELDCRDRLLHFQLSGPTREEAYEEVLRVAVEFAQARWAVLFLLRNEKLEAVAALGFSFPGCMENAEKIAEIPAIDSHGKTLLAQALRLRRMQSARREVAVPMFYRDEVIGIFQVGGIATVREEKNGLNALWNIGREAALVLRMAGVTDELSNGELDIEKLLELGA